MEQITITKPNLSTVKIGTTSPYSKIVKAEQSMTLMGEDKVDIEATSQVALNITVGDFITVYGRKYTLLDPVEIDRVSASELKYTLSFKGGIHECQKVLFKMSSTLGVALSSDFTLTADLTTFIDLIITNMNEVYGTGKWERGIIPDTDVKTLIFSNETCQAVLSRFAEEFKQEYHIDYVDGSWVINMDVKVGRDLPDVYAYGQASGCLYIKKKFVNDETFVTKLYALGSQNNLPADYRNYSNRLKMPASLPTDFEAPTAPQNLHIFNTGFQMARLGWSASTDNVGVTGYRIYRSDAGGSYYLFATTADITYDMYGIPFNTDINFKVKAYDAMGNVSLASNVVSYNIGLPFSPPTMLYIEEAEEGLNVFWTEPPTNYEQIEIYRSLDGNAFTLRDTIDYPIQNYHDVSAISVPGRTYSYKARSKYQAYYSSFSNIISQTF